MITKIGKLADRLLSAVAPKAEAGACACGGNWCTDQRCGGPNDYLFERVYELCDCTIYHNCIC
jgi:hypothetical protein